MNDLFKVTEDYKSFLDDLRERIGAAQVRAALAVNSELMLLYWGIGRAILERQRQHGWGAKVVDRLSADLRRAFPDMKGFSPRNLKYMRRSPKRTLTSSLCNRLLHKSLGATT